MFDDSFHSDLSSANSIGYSDKYWATADGLQIAARQWSPPAGDSESPIRGTVLIVHGMGEHSGRFEFVAGKLVENGFHVVCPDLRGHGRSQGPRGYIRSFDSLNDDLDLALQQTRIVDRNLPCFLYGHSMGGLAALYFAMHRNPDVTGLIVTSPALRILSPAPAWKISVGRWIRRFCPWLPMNSGLDIHELSDDPQVAERIQCDRFQHGKITPAAYFGMVEAGRWCLDQASELKCRTLLMHGNDDRITDSRASAEFAESTNTVRLKLWDHGKHELHNMTWRHKVMDHVIQFQNMCIHEGCQHTDPASPFAAGP